MLGTSSGLQTRWAGFDSLVPRSVHMDAWLHDLVGRRGLQSRVARFDSGWSLNFSPTNIVLDRRTNT
jgi:hypothetical protein